MYSPSSPGLSSFNCPLVDRPSSQCLKYKYFTIFLICTTSMTLLSASLATHKWVVSKPIRVLKINGGQTNLSSILTNHHHYYPEVGSERQQKSTSFAQHLISTTRQGNIGDQKQTIQADNKFQGEIFIGPLSGVKVLNYGFGDRVSQISVIQAAMSSFPNFAKDNSSGSSTPSNGSPQESFVDFRLWITTLVSVVMALLFELCGSILSIINFVMTPEATLSGPIGLVLVNSFASFSCLSAIICWTLNFVWRIKRHILSQEEMQNGWSAEQRTQLGYSFYLLIIAFVLCLINVFIVSFVQFKGMTKKRKARAICEGVIMLY